MGKPTACIITNQCLQIRTALEASLPGTRHRWCIWHILKKIPQKFLGNRRFEEINTHMKKIFQNCLKDKKQKELVCDAADLKGVVPYVSSSPIEKQFQREYTNSKFKEVQEQFLKKADCTISSIK
ncbi:hypothetical protein PIB30_105044 [Stylosanthes scabra]|uniref:Protein FAR1-RELATED SEQUENCE n=1 Tax=Stylosanthes scabra TaxID=79078 RepID=A0ABU6VYZ0_9FABA|nr:hypothetical protein [Stylosanthes scabra]